VKSGGPSSLGVDIFGVVVVESLETSGEVEETWGLYRSCSHVGWEGEVGGLGWATGGPCCWFGAAVQRWSSSQAFQALELRQCELIGSVL
jgi:hypothetical protein